MPSEKEKKENALEISIKEGAGANIAGSLGDASITPFVLALNASSFHVGLLNALAGIFQPLAMLWGDKTKSSRKQWVIKCVFIQALLWIPLALIAFYAYKNGAASTLIYLTIAIYVILYSLAGLLYPSWFSWMGDLVNKNERGRYFSKRNAATGAVGFALTILGSLILDTFKQAGYLMIAFGILFIGATIGRLTSAYFFRKQYEPVNTQKDGKDGTFLKFIRKNNNLTKFVWILTLFNFALMIASPFFGVYILTKLSYSYLMYAVVMMSNTGFYLIFTPIVGKFADRYGSVPLLKVSLWLFAITPPLWIILKNPLFLILIPQLLSGMANATLTVATTTFSYESMPAEKRGKYVAYMNVLVGGGILFGSLIGGALLSYLPKVSNVFFIVFIISAIARALVALIGTFQIKPEKIRRKIPDVSINLLHPLRMIHTDTHFIKQILK